jgi:tetratricopeptide (TPR) repeat protein
VTVQFQSRLLVAFAMLATLAGAGEAQPVRRPPRVDTPRMTVQVFRSADKIAGPAASDALRERLIQIYPGPVLWVIEKPNMIELLEQSGYPTNEQLARSDENQLAKFLRTDEYIRGSVVREADGQWRAEAQLVLTRDASLTQMLPPSRGSRPERAAVGLVRAIQDARRQLDNEKRCMEHARANRYDAAIAEADRAIAEYPAATLVRYCKMNVLLQKKAPNAEVIIVANEILELDPNNRAALAVAADAQKAEGNATVANELMIRLLTNEPTNTSLAETVIENLAASGQMEMAKEVVLKAVTDNPGDVDLVRLQFLVLARTRDFKLAITTGEELVQLDTAMADVSYFTRMISLYAADSQPAKSVEMAQRATTKFPTNPMLWQTYATILRQSGQLAPSVDAMKRALALNPFIPNGWLIVAQGYGELQQPDSQMVAFRNALGAGESADMIAGVIAGIGNQKRIQGGNDKNLDILREGVRILHWADTIATLADSTGPEGSRVARVRATDETKGRVQFLLGATAVTLFREAATAAGAARSCDLAREAEGALNVALIALPQAARTEHSLKQNAIQLAGNLPDFQAYIAQQKASFCR